jgi:hypothetical protein
MHWLVTALYYIGAGLGILVFLGLMLKVAVNLAASIKRTNARSGNLHDKENRGP